MNKKLTIALGAAVLGVALIPATARASTPECTGGTYAGYCGTQADNGSPVLVMDVKGLKFNVGNPVIGWTNSSTDPATDWVQLPYKGDPALGVMFFASPTGVNLDLCMADPGNGWSCCGSATGRTGSGGSRPRSARPGSSPGPTAPPTAS